MMKTYTTKSGYRISRVLGGRANVYLINTSNNHFLVDTGMSFSFQKLIQNLNLNLNLTLILTHTHFDHCQNAGRLQHRFGCNIIMSREAAIYAQQGYTPIPEGTNLLTKGLVWAGRRIRIKALTYQPFSADMLIDHPMGLQDQNLNIDIIPTPGHSADSISIIVDNEIALVGDSLFGMFPNSIFPPFADDVPLLYQSWQILQNTGCHTFLPGHGRSISRKKLEKILLANHQIFSL